jgi:DUF4097 and DUF4098 domain-containing protein YvlB
MKRTLGTTLVLVIALVTVASNRGTAAQGDPFHLPQDDTFLSQKAAGDEAREEFHKSYPLSANGRVSIENINGAVRIAVWDQNEVKVDAVKRAYWRERLEEAKIEVDTTADSIRIKTQYPERDQTFTNEQGRRYDNPATVEYALTIPRRARIESAEVINGSLDIDGAEGDVKASSINGYVKARALMGEVRLSTVNGGLEASFMRLEETKPVSLNSVNGGIVLVLPSDANAQVRASTLHGGVSNEFGLPVISGEYVGHELYGQIGTGGPRIKLGNVNGRITIRHASDGRSLSPSTNLISEKDKSDKSDKSIAKMHAMNDQVRQAAQQARESARAQIDAERVNRDVAAQTQREVERALRESQRETERAIRESQREVERAQAQIQREVQRAQVQVQRDVQRQVREQVRESTRAGIGAGVGSGIGRGIGAGRGAGRFIDRESKTFPVSGTPSVNVGTFDGSVIIHGWDKPEVMYTAIKRANHEESLKNINVESSQRGAAISIIAKSTDEDGSTALELYVPHNTNLHLSSEDGRLSVQGVSGELVARTGDGSIEVEGGRGRLEANTGDGRIRVVDFQGEVDARTGDGTITLEGNFTGVQARTGDGSIVLGVPAGSNFVIETNADGVTNEGLTISEETSASTRVKRWKVGNGGAVFTLNTGDGRVILRPH